MSVKEVSKGIWSFEEDHSSCFLVVGHDRALLIDTSRGTTDLYTEVRKITDLPVTLVNTHSDLDHTGNNAKFEEDCWIHPEELAKLRLKGGLKGDYKPAKEGHVFDLGGRKLRVIECPGHTDGSIALFEEETGVLFTGDTVSEASIYMFGDGRDGDKLIKSLRKLEVMGDAVKFLYPSHGPCPVEPEGIYNELAELMESIKNGAKTDETDRVDFDGADFDVFVHRKGRASIFTV